jgi:hypothetical protein
MITVPELAAEALSALIADFMRSRFGSEAELCELVPSIARTALECIGNSDALYHNIEHTMLVTLVGHDIMRGRGLHSHMTADDYSHVIIACLTHDIGYVRGILKNDDEDGYAINSAGKKMKPPRGSSDAALLQHHVDRSKLFVMERMQGMELLDAARIARAIEGTRFPSSMPAEVEQIDEEAALVRAADLIGQLGDPHYIRKANALYHEFEEAGLNRQLGYQSPADLVNKYPQFYWNCIAPNIQTAIKYLDGTAGGRQWVANLYSNIFRAERDIAMFGPQK